MGTTPYPSSKGIVTNNNKAEEVGEEKLDQTQQSAPSLNPLNP